MKTKEARQYEAYMVKYFGNLARQHPPDSIKRVGWTSRQTQLARFEVLCQSGLLEGKSVLDVGCGVGDFYGYLMEVGYRGDYTGYDLLPENCEAATEKYNRSNFYAKNVLDTTQSKKFDFVVASGIFFLRSDNWERVVRSTLKRMYELCRTCMAANFLSAYVEPENEESYHVYPCKIIEICTDMTTIFQIRHDYSTKGNDFTLFAYREINNP